jgi:hypothetical protein
VSERRFTLMGYGGASAWPTVEAVTTVDPVAVMEAARRMLANAGDCDRVEIWSGRELIHTLRRDA